MEQQDGYVQVTIHYINGHTDSFNIQTLTEEAQGVHDIRQEVRRFLDRPWWIFQLPEQTITINMTQVLKVEIKPALPEILGEGVFPFAERVTALSRHH